MYIFFMLFIQLFSIEKAEQKRSIHCQVISFFNQDTLRLEKQYRLNNLDYQFEQIQFYISNFKWYHNNQLVFEEPNSFHLIDVDNSETCSWTLTMPDAIEFDEFTFDFGIDSLTNVSGAFSGALDPVHGMYWAWQSGYINAKIEGTSSICPTRNNKFQFHLGGYMGANNACQHLRMKCLKNELALKFDLQNLMQQIDLKQQNQLMIPCPEAVQMSKIMANSFSSLP